LVVGAPFFARGYGNGATEENGLFQRADPAAAGEYRTIDWRALVRRRPADHGFRRHWSAEAQVPWLYNPETLVFITYEGPDGVRVKAHYVRAHGFGGLMFWELGSDDGTLLQVIHEAFTTQ
ncbi:MAG: glycosyl hydrolase family 18 protein, partial [Longimicrobiales bacterium]